MSAFTSFVSDLPSITEIKEDFLKGQNMIWVT